MPCTRTIDTTSLSSVAVGVSTLTVIDVRRSAVTLDSRLRYRVRSCRVRATVASRVRKIVGLIRRYVFIAYCRLRRRPSPTSSDVALDIEDNSSTFLALGP